MAPKSMTIRCRPMQYADIPACLELFSSHPLLVSRYAGALPQLGETWERLLGHQAFVAVIVEEPTRTGHRILALGTRLFLTDAFLTELKTPPFRWVGPDIVRRVLTGRSPALSDKQLREANTGDGLNLFAWDAAIGAHGRNRLDVVHSLFAEFARIHCGFLLKEFLSQCASSVEMLDAQLHSGDLVLNEHGRYTSPASLPPLSDLLRTPHYLGITRELALRQYGTWVSTLFNYSPPLFHLRPSQQRLLLLALGGLTDQELADRLCISLSAVKECWRRIYDTVADRNPKLIPDVLLESGSHERGAMKKQRLLAYLREHMEELRPLQSPQ